MQKNTIFDNARRAKPALSNAITRLVSAFGLAFTVSSMMFLASGCPGGTEGKPTQVEKCETYNDDENACKAATQTGDNKKCVYENNKCVPEGPEGQRQRQQQNKCKALDKTSCEKQMDCKFDNNECQATPSNCNNVKDSTTCDTTFAATCAWNATSSKCEQKSAVASIYKWKLMPAPANKTWADVKFFTVSGDNTHAYAYVGDATEAHDGFYYTSDRGTTWSRFGGDAIGDGTVRGQVSSEAKTKNSDWESKTSLPVEIKPTQKGVVVLGPNSRGIWLIEGATVKWAILKGVNNQNNLPTLVDGFINQDIKFVDVVDINGVETIAFAQVAQSPLWLKRTDGGEYDGVLAKGHPKSLKIMSKAANDKELDGKPNWLRAGNTYEKDLLLAGSGAKGIKGIWQIAKTELPVLDETKPALNPAPIQDQPVLFPETLKNWDPTNFKVTVIGSLDNATRHEYFAGMTIDTNEPGQLAHHTGIQSGIEAAALSLFDGAKTAVLGLSNIFGKTRIRTQGKGILGVSPDAQPLPANDLKISDFAASKNDMMDDIAMDPVPFVAAHDKDLINVFGDDHQSFFWLGGNTAEAGVYMREKTTGSPRP